MLFTFVVDYKGGIYVSQVRANSPEEAVIIWAKNLDTKPIIGLKSKSKTKLIEQLQQQVEEGATILLDGLKNAWCASAMIKHKLLLINIVKTSQT